MELAIHLWVEQVEGVGGGRDASSLDLDSGELGAAGVFLVEAAFGVRVFKEKLMRGERGRRRGG